MFLDALKIHGWHRLHRTAAVSQTRPDQTESMPDLDLGSPPGYRQNSSGAGHDRPE